MTLDSIPHADKLMHFGICSGLSAVALYLGLPPEVTLTGGFALAAGKELYDAAHPEAHTADGWDAYWTAAGSLFACVAAWLL